MIHEKKISIEIDNISNADLIVCTEPFDPSKIHNFFNQEWPGVIRSKGFFWIS